MITSPSTILDHLTSGWQLVRLQSGAWRLVMEGEPAKAVKAETVYGMVSEGQLQYAGAYAAVIADKL